MRSKLKAACAALAPCVALIVRRGLDYGRQGFSQWDLT
jgi:hypothetical protein